jgi:hypothetical protein
MIAIVMLIQVACAVYMTGVIWLIQLIHYPCFAWIETERFAQFHRRHTTAMGAIVGPVMVLEMVSAVGLVWLSAENQWFWRANLVGVLALWGATFLLSVPLHNELERGKNLVAIRKLVSTNWTRTALWSARTMALVLLLGSKAV